MRWDLLRLFIASGIVLGVVARLLSGVIGWLADSIDRWRTT